MTPYLQGSFAAHPSLQLRQTDDALAKEGVKIRDINSIYLALHR